MCVAERGRFGVAIGQPVNSLSVSDGTTRGRWDTHCPVPLANQVVRVMSPLDICRKSWVDAKEASLAAVTHADVSGESYARRTLP